ncbi:hypothetical protein EDD21DRAFT_421787, partial [Dissophora ornata]
MGSLTEPTKRATRSTVKTTTTTTTTATSSSSNSSDLSDSDIVDSLSVVSSASSVADSPVIAKHVKEMPKIATKNDFSVLYEPWTIGNFYKKLDWVHVLGLVFMPIYGFYMAFTSVPLQQKTAIFSVLYYFFTGLGITA